MRDQTVKFLQSLDCCRLFLTLKWYLNFNYVSISNRFEIQWQLYENAYLTYASYLNGTKTVVYKVSTWQFYIRSYKLVDFIVKQFFISFQNGNVVVRHILGTRRWSWRRSSTLTATWRAGDGSKSLTHSV